MLGFIPLVFSLDRGSWLSSAVVAVYGVLRMLQSGKGKSRRMAKAASSLMLAGLVVVGLIFLSPLGHDILTRRENG